MPLKPSLNCHRIEPHPSCRGTYSGTGKGPSWASWESRLPRSSGHYRSPPGSACEGGSQGCLHQRRERHGAGRAVSCLLRSEGEGNEVTWHTSGGGQEEAGFPAYKGQWPRPNHFMENDMSLNKAELMDKMHHVRGHPLVVPAKYAGVGSLRVGPLP